ncbi:MAG TPA: hypothetical protein VGM53_21285 [Streptosporangiaceae bacterium]|jgi:hypothetical protein
MSISQRTTRYARTALLAVVAGGAGLLGVGGVAQASVVQAGPVHAAASHAGPNGWVTTDTCTGVSGKVVYTGGMRKLMLRSIHATLTGTTSGCSDIFNGAESGTGTLTAVLSGKASKAAENFSGTFTINWPASSGFNPSNGNLSVTESNGLETVSGSITSGFDTGSAVAMQYVITGTTGKGIAGHPITSQTYTNTQPLTLSRNEG